MKLRPAILLGAGVSLCLASSLALAASGSGAAGGLGSIAQNITGTMGAVAKLLTAGAYVFGIFLMIVALFKFKAHKDNPQQVTLGTAIAILLVGAALVFIPSVIRSGGATIFGEDASIGTASGFSNLSGG